MSWLQRMAEHLLEKCSLRHPAPQHTATERSDSMPYPNALLFIFSLKHHVHIVNVFVIIHSRVLKTEIQHMCVHNYSFCTPRHSLAPSSVFLTSKFLLFSYHSIEFYVICFYFYFSVFVPIFSLIYLWAETQWINWKTPAIDLLIRLVDASENEIGLRRPATQGK